MPTPWPRRPDRHPPPPDADDDALLTAARSDPEAFGRFYDRHAPAVLRFFARRTPDAEVAADLTAETFACTLADAHRFDPTRGTARAWLFGIARHQLWRYLRDQRVATAARARLGMQSVPLDDLSCARIDELVDARRARPWLEAALAALTPTMRTTLELRVVDGLSYREIADRTRTTTGAARVRVARALAQLARAAPAARAAPIGEPRP